MYHPQPNAPTCIVTDASDVAIEAVLQQQIQSQWCPIAYFSRKLKPAERNYSAFNRELLAIYQAVQHFCYFVVGRQFHIATDHKPITFALSRSSKQHSPHQIWHLDFIAQFTMDIRHIKGADNTAADTLSRVEIDGLQTNGTPLDCQALAKAQQEDDTQPALTSTSLQLQVVPVPGSSTTLLCDVSTMHTPQTIHPTYSRVSTASHVGRKQYH